ncbi:hypothetical protein HanPSC8_Chr06g0236871 [Helianthus annuus]|nr:hypothetical protein HanPSC8_Chr06g0236871 [Helianthus annuus]
MGPLPSQTGASKQSVASSQDQTADGPLQILMELKRTLQKVLHLPS